MKVLLSSNPDNLRTELAKYKLTATVEAEYGDVVVEGSVLTLAHHGPRKHHPPPCLRDNNPVELDAIGLSHLDLDALGGILSLTGQKPMAYNFWQLAGWVDVTGPHKLTQAPEDFITVSNTEALYAWWAWVAKHRVYPPRDGSVRDVTEDVQEAEGVLHRILRKRDEELLQEGEEFRENEKELNEASMVEAIGPVLVRSSDQFVNHLYVTPNGGIYKAVVALKKETGEITISLADPIEGVSCVELAQEQWGSEAGGHVGIAGGPRSGGFKLEDAIVMAEKMAKVILAT
jgi:hypothetical protein